MKIADIENKKSIQKLTEEIGANNTTVFLTEDLADIANQEQNNVWSEPMSADQLLESMDSWLN